MLVAVVVRVGMLMVLVALVGEAVAVERALPIQAVAVVDIAQMAVQA
jgi:hypothetical protein